jgi:hypothetical protein
MPKSVLRRLPRPLRRLRLRLERLRLARRERALVRLMG